MSAIILRPNFNSRPRPMPGRYDFEAEYREAMVRAGLWERGRSERPCDSEPPESAA